MIFYLFVIAFLFFISNLKYHILKSSNDKQSSSSWCDNNSLSASLYESFEFIIFPQHTNSNSCRLACTRESVTSRNNTFPSEIACSPFLSLSLFSIKLNQHWTVDEEWKTNTTWTHKTTQLLDPGLCVNWVNDNCNIPEAHQTIHEEAELEVTKRSKSFSRKQKKCKNLR